MQVSRVSLNLPWRIGRFVWSIRVTLSPRIFRRQELSNERNPNIRLNGTEHGNLCEYFQGFVSRASLYWSQWLMQNKIWKKSAKVRAKITSHRFNSIQDWSTLVNFTDEMLLTAHGLYLATRNHSQACKSTIIRTAQLKGNRVQNFHKKKTLSAREKKLAVRGLPVRCFSSCLLHPCLFSSCQFGKS